MKTAIFRANVDTPYGLFTIAVNSTEHDAKADIFSAIRSEFPMHIGQPKVKDVRKSNRRIISKMDELPKCFDSRSGQWAWISKQQQ